MEPIQPDVPGDLSTAAILPLDAPINGAFDFLRDSDWYRFDATRGVVYEATLSNATDTDIQVAIREPIRVLGTFAEDGAPSTVSFVAEDNGPHFISAFTFADSGEYNLILTEIGIDDFVATADTTGRLRIGEPTTGEFLGLNDQDWFAFEVEAGQTYQVEMNAPTLDLPSVDIVDASGNVVAFSVADRGGDPVSSFLAEESGVLFAAVTANSRVSGAYELTLTELGADDFAGDLTTSGMLTLEAPVTGAFQFRGDADWFAFEVEDGSVYDVTTTAREVQAWREDGSFITSVSNTETFSIGAEESGTIFLAVVQSGIELGPYELSVVQGEDDFPDDATTTGVLTPDAPATGQFDFIDDSDWFRVSLEAGRLYTFEARLTEEVESFVGPILDLFDGSGEPIDDLQSGDLDPGPLLREFSPISSGDFFLSVAEGSRFDPDLYEIELRDVTVPRPVPESLDAFDAVIRGTPGDDRLFGSDRNDFITGGAGRDNINGGPGDDYIAAGPGNDGFLRGGPGADIFQFGPGDGAVKIFDFELGADRIFLTGGLERGDLREVELGAIGGNSSFFTTQGDRLEILGVRPPELLDRDFITGRASPDPFDPSRFDSRVADGDGDSRLKGGDLRDFITGGGGRDNINAGAGDDYIDAGPGNDGFVRGGAGADLFVFGLGSDRVKIFDWEDGVDRIALTGGLVFEDFEISSSEFNGVVTTRLTTVDKDRLELRGVSLDDLSEADFFTL